MQYVNPYSWGSPVANELVSQQAKECLDAGVYEGYARRAQDLDMDACLSRAELPIIPVYEQATPFPGIDLYKIDPDSGKILLGSMVSVSVFDAKTQKELPLEGFQEEHIALLKAHLAQLGGLSLGARWLDN